MSADDIVENANYQHRFLSCVSTTQLAYVLTFLISCSAGFSTMPLISLVEAAVCQDHLNRQSSADCKSSHVQIRVANILAVEASIESAVGLLVAVPWSSAVKRIRRNGVLMLALCGVIINELWWIAIVGLHPLVPIELGWLSSLGLLCGGGAPVLIAQIFAIVTEVESEETRSIAFTRIHVASMLGGMLAPGLVSVLVRTTGHAEVGLWLGILCAVGATCLVSYLPDTTPPPPSRARGDDNAVVDDSSQVTQPLLENIQHKTKIRAVLFHSIPLAALLLVSVLLQPIGPSTTQFLVQYAANRFNVVISDMGYILAFYGFLQLLQALLFLPWISRRWIVVENQHQDTPHDKSLEQRRDVRITRTLVSVLIPGLLVLAIAPSLAVFLVGLAVMALGSAHGSYVKSLMVNFVDPTFHSALFGVTAMVDVAGSVYSAFMLARLFKTGLDLGGVMIGIPYLVLTAFVMVAELVLFVV